MENPQQEPSMEEILASIRRIISEDEEDGATAEAAATTEPATAEAVQPSSVVSVVSEQVQPPLDQDAADARLETEDLEMVKNNVTAAVQETAEAAMLDTQAANAATQSFQNLTRTIRVSEGDGRTLEDLVTQMLQPMVKQWLDSNLPQIVEDKVEEEVQRVARRRG